MAAADPRKVALVTGAGRGLGKEISRQLASGGMRVLATARDAERGLAAVAELVTGTEGGDIRFARLDVTAADSIASVAELVQTEFGRLDVLVNNAGITGIPRGIRRPLDELTVADLRAVLETNFLGVFAVTQAFLPMLRKSGGRVINLTSALATFERCTTDGTPRAADLIPYCTSKAAANLLSVLYSRLLEEAGVTVCAVSPGHVATDMNNFTGPKPVEEGAAVVVRYAFAGAADLPGDSFLTEGGSRPW